MTGGGGSDTAVVSGSIDDCSITVNDNRVVVSYQVGGDGTDKLYDVSFLRFSDATFDLTGGSGGASPEAQNDTATGTEDSALVIDVLGNDSSPGGGALTVAAVTQGANGSVTINPDNSLTYTPAPDFFGTADRKSTRLNSSH